LLEPKRWAQPPEPMLMETSPEVQNLKMGPKKVGKMKEKTN
jgi:hypothetical protein